MISSTHCLDEDALDPRDGSIVEMMRLAWGEGLDKPRCAFLGRLHLSSRSAAVGRTRLARQAGRVQATRAAAMRVPVAVSQTPGS